MDGIDDDARPEVAAVLADPPAFRFEPPFPLCGLQRPQRYVRGPILVGIEAGEMLADDLGSGIALHPLRARVPVRDVPGRIEHEDGVVGDALDQQAELLLAPSQGFLGRFALGDVAGDLGEAEQVSVFVTDGVDDDAGPEAAAVLANPPAFRLVLPFRHGGGERLLRHSCLPILFGVEAGEVLADDLDRPCSP